MHANNHKLTCKDDLVLDLPQFEYNGNTTDFNMCNSGVIYITGPKLFFRIYNVHFIFDISFSKLPTYPPSFLIAG